MSSSSSQLVLPLSIAESRPSGAAVVCYRLFQRLAKKFKGAAHASYKEIAKMMGKSVRSVAEYVRQLRAAGWIETQQHPKNQHLFIRPLLKVAPSRASYRPRPAQPWTKPEIELPAESQDATADSTSAKTASVPASVSASDLSTITSGTEVKQYRKPREKAETDKPALPLPPGSEAVVAMMQKAGVDPGTEAKYLAEINIEAMKEACRYILYRAKHGFSAGGGMVIKCARNIAAGRPWKMLAGYEKERAKEEERERREERERIHAQKTEQARAAAYAPIIEGTQDDDVPEHWLPGVTATETKRHVRNATNFLLMREREKAAADPDYFAQEIDMDSPELMDQVRKEWRKMHQRETSPWEDADPVAYENVGAVRELLGGLLAQDPETAAIVRRGTRR